MLVIRIPGPVVLRAARQQPLHHRVFRSESDGSGRGRPSSESCRLWDSTWFWFRLRATGLHNSHNLHMNILAPPAVWDRDRDREPSRGSLSGPC